MSLQQIVHRASEKAQGVSVVILTQETSTVDFENNRLKTAASSQRTQIEVKVIVNGKVGMSTTTDPMDIDGVVDHAIEAAEFGGPAHFELHEPQALEPVKIFDPALLSLAKPEMVRMGQQMMDMILAYNPEILADAGVYKTVSKIEYANSRGTQYSADHTDFYVSAGGQLVRGTDILFAGHHLAQKKRALDTEEIANQAIEYFRLAEHIAPIESGEMPVIFTPRGLSALMLSLALAVDGKNAYLGASPLRDKLGQQIASPSLTIIDDPFVEYGSNSSPFDDEGVARKVTPIIDNGVLRNFIYDLDSAGRAGVKPTGHGFNRDLTNLVISPGVISYEAMLRSTPKGLLVHGYLGLGQGNPINGEFSVNLWQAYKIENGKLVGRVKNAMLAGNAFEALKDITAISKEREWVGGPYAWFTGLTPYIKVGKLSVTTK